jgi:hypothetical protein
MNVHVHPWGLAAAVVVQDLVSGLHAVRVCVMRACVLCVSKVGVCWGEDGEESLTDVCVVCEQGGCVLG